MSKAHIISNNQHYSQQIASFLENKNWDTNTLGPLDVMGQETWLAKDKTCLIFVICRDFFTQSQTSIEMSTVVKDYARHMPVYLLFETEFHPLFKRCKQYAKRVYENILSDTTRSEALKNIVRLEANTLPREAFMSPMDSI